ncbi:MAG: membrane protein insertase YidC, partial [Rhodocyclales bacterium]|nr:membrane protein insertase YidC [Rhodocyclales bacterium]
MDNRRLILLLVFSFSMVMLWDGWQKHNHPQAPAATAAAQNGGVPTPGAASPGAAAVPGQSAPVASAAPKAIIRTDVLEAEVSAQGGDIVRLELTQHKATEDHTRNYVLFDKGEKHVYSAQTGLVGNNLPNHKTLFALGASSLDLKDGQDAVTLRLDAPEQDGIKVAKLITFHRGSYQADVSYEVTNGSGAPIAPHAYFQFTRDGKPAEQPGGFGVQTFTGPAFYTDADKYQKVEFSD